MTEVESTARNGPKLAMLAIVLAGGASTRMAGQDKLALPLVDKPLLDHAVDAVASADLIITVGPPRQTGRSVHWTREQPPGGGPVAAIAAGLVAADRLGDESQFVAVIAGDMPLAGGVIGTLLRAAEAADCDVAIAVGADGRDQPLLAIWRRTALSDVLAACESTAGTSARSLLAGVRVARVPVTGDATRDCDEQQDLYEVAAIIRGRSGR